ncbi:MarR family transcriptional regulator [Amycolatopsis bartoniae]|nr:MarR family transcriptional regulator [Amycolatopsis bartoniae]
MLYLIKQLELAVRASLDEVLRPAELTPLQYTALTVLQRRDNLTTAELARNSLVTDQTMAGMIVTLERRGLIERENDAQDRRRRVIRLTEAGRGVLDRFAGPVAAIEERMLAGLGPEDAEGLRRSVLHCHAALADRVPH